MGSSGINASYMGTAILLPNYYVYPGHLLPAPAGHAGPQSGLSSSWSRLDTRGYARNKKRERCYNYHYVYQDDDEPYQDNVWYLEPEDMRRKREGVDSLPLKTKRDDEARLVEGHHG